MKRVLAVVLAIVMMVFTFSALSEPTGEYYYYVQLTKHYLLFQIDTGWQDLLLDNRISLTLDENDEHGAMMFTFNGEDGAVPLFALSVRKQDAAYAPEGYSNIAWTREKDDYVVELFIQAEAGGYAYDTVIQSLSDIENACHFMSPQEMWDFSVIDMNGNTLSAVELFSGNALTIVNVWTTYCPTCIEEMPDLSKLSKEYADRGVKFIGIVSDVYEGQDGQYAKKLIEETGADFCQLYANDRLGTLLLGSVQYVPTTFIFDENRTVVDMHVGSLAYDSWVEKIEELLKG